MADFRIGTTLGGMVNLEELSVPLDPPKSTFLPAAVTRKTGNGTKRGFGFPIAIWSFPVMNLDQRNQLKIFCTGASASVYIRTKKDDDNYADYQATMNWPDDDTSDRWYGERKNILIEFVNLVAA